MPKHWNISWIILTLKVSSWWSVHMTLGPPNLSTWFSTISWATSAEHNINTRATIVYIANRSVFTITCFAQMRVAIVNGPKKSIARMLNLIPKTIRTLPIARFCCNHSVNVQPYSRSPKCLPHLAGVFSNESCPPPQFHWMLTVQNFLPIKLIFFPKRPVRQHFGSVLDSLFSQVHHEQRHYPPFVG